MSCLEWERPHPYKLLFAHANGFNAQTYRSLLAPLEQSLHVFACDLRGHGSSTLPTTTDLADGWRIFATDLMALLTALSDTPFILAGHSLGATASLMMATLAPERVRALVLIEPVLLPALGAGASVPPNELAKRAATRRSTFPDFAAAFDAYRGRSIFASWPDTVLRDYLTGGLVAKSDSTLGLACAPEWEAEIFRNAPHDLAHLAPQISCPITILHGTKGSATTDQQLAEILRAKPDTRTVCVRGASHFLPMEYPDLVRDEIRRITD